MTFTSGDDLYEEHVYKNTSTWIEKAKARQEPNLISQKNMGLDLPSCRRRDMIDVVVWDHKNKALLNLLVQQDGLVAS